MAAVTDDRTWNGLMQPRFILSQFWRPGVCNHDVGRTTLHLKGVGESLPLLVSGGSKCCLI